MNETETPKEAPAPVAPKGENGIPQVPGSPLDQLEMLAALMMKKALSYGTGNMGRFVFDSGQAIRESAKSIREGLAEVDRMILEGEKVSAERLKELQNIKGSRFYRAWAYLFLRK